jgi:hypothetical protein
MHLLEYVTKQVFHAPSWGSKVCEESPENIFWVEISGLSVVLTLLKGLLCPSEAVVARSALRVAQTSVGLAQLLKGCRR